MAARPAQGAMALFFPGRSLPLPGVPSSSRGDSPRAISMSRVTLEVASLAKAYQIGGLQKSHYRLTDQLADLFMAPFRRAGKLLRGQATGAAELDETFWALKDVSFQIKSGEVVGIIG